MDPKDSLPPPFQQSSVSQPEGSETKTTTDSCSECKHNSEAPSTLTGEAKNNHHHHRNRPPGEKRTRVNKNQPSLHTEYFEQFDQIPKSDAIFQKRRALREELYRMGDVEDDDEKEKEEEQEMEGNQNVSQSVDATHSLQVSENEMKNKNKNKKEKENKKKKECEEELSSSSASVIIPPDRVGTLEMYRRFPSQYDLIMARHDCSQVHTVMMTLLDELSNKHKHAPLRVADLGCGTGRLAAMAVQHPSVEYVYCYDKEEAMLERCVVNVTSAAIQAHRVRSADVDMNVNVNETLCISLMPSATSPPSSYIPLCTVKNQNNNTNNNNTNNNNSSSRSGGTSDGQMDTPENPKREEEKPSVMRNLSICTRPVSFGHIRNGFFKATEPAVEYNGEVKGANSNNNNNNNSTMNTLNPVHCVEPPPRQEDRIALTAAPHPPCDMVVCAWALSYVMRAAWGETRWHDAVDGVLAEMTSLVLQEKHTESETQNSPTKSFESNSSPKNGHGVLVIIETLGTDTVEPKRQNTLMTYLEEKHQFVRQWVRTDYNFDSLEQAEQLTRFFFGRAMAQKVQEEKLTCLHECTGIWVKRIGTTN